jgi:3-hydroxyacyl-[acyl-carrier protein] dehydratase/trans-2-decenoyl-[acyl-carrier protein] isomerase
MVTPRIARIEYVVDIKRVLLRRLKLAIADGAVKADGEIVCTATDVTVGLADIDAPSNSAPVA